ncbi:non-canonical purine NTP pyrophosphatase [Patescibacteria group bacterium]|nr:non-canonical purine NTP pyrophosphatase [Patescibacteria group bacterium]MCL5409697.1 non-canonical purine NTP pyrophosphatase [Patescibacteria group bacterium]
MSLYFITGNKHKFAEIKAMLPQIEQLEIDLPEIQSANGKTVVESKLQEAFGHHSGQFIIEDSGLYMNCLNGLPGPLVKWFLEKIGCVGLANLAIKLKNSQAEAITLLGYAQTPKQVHFFEGRVLGKIVKPRGKNGFGWDVIFQPEGFRKTYAQMSTAEKNQISMRKIALQKLKDFLER